MKIMFAALAFLLLMAWTKAPHAVQGKKFIVMMSGAEEAPGPGDPDGSGVAILRLNQGQGTVDYEIMVENIGTNITGAHIHIAPVGDPGPVVIPLMAPVDGFSSGTAIADAELIKAIRKNPGGYYVNVHTAEYPGGAVRGQLGN